MPWRRFNFRRDGRVYVRGRLAAGRARRQAPESVTQDGQNHQVAPGRSARCACRQTCQKRCHRDLNPQRGDARRVARRAGTSVIIPTNDRGAPRLGVSSAATSARREWRTEERGIGVNAR
jgi:hypothetical protein